MLAAYIWRGFPGICSTIPDGGLVIEFVMHICYIYSLLHLLSFLSNVLSSLMDVEAHDFILKNQ